MAFSMFLASIPMMALVGSVVANVLHGDLAALRMLSGLMDLAPDEVRALLDRNLARGTDQSAAPLFLLGALWLGATAFHDAMTVFEKALEAKRRTWVRKRLIALSCVLAVMALLALAGVLALARAGGAIGLLRTLIDPIAELWPALTATSVAAGVTGLLVASFFRIAVVHRSRHPRVWPGTLATVLLGTLASYTFASYARSLASYALFYGSLAAVAIFMLWLWIMCIALLIGVELNATLEREALEKRV
jgi:membrane protein